MNERVESLTVDGDIRSARTLPPFAFQDRRIAQEEQRAIHQRGFQLLAPTALPVTDKSSTPSDLLQHRWLLPAMKTHPNGPFKYLHPCLVPGGNRTD